MSLTFADVCLITEHVPRLARFYETLFGVSAEGDDTHSFLALPGLGIALYSRDAAERDDPGLDFQSPRNDRWYIGFQCEDADAAYERVCSLRICSPTEPKRWPWGAKSFYLKDPDGNRIVIRSWPKEES